MANSDSHILIRSLSWAATPDNYSSMRYLQFKQEGTGIAMYGYGQTIYAKINFNFSITDDQLLFDYQQSDPTQRSGRFDPTGSNARKQIGFSVEQGEFIFGEDITSARFRFTSKLTLSDSPYPAGLEFPYSVPTEFFGFRERIETET